MLYPLHVHKDEHSAYGGRFFGRAFDPSQMLGDHCWAVLAELRFDVPTPWKQLTRVQAYTYMDHGQVYFIDPAPGTPKTNHGTSAGLGVRGAEERGHRVGGEVEGGALALGHALDARGHTQRVGERAPHLGQRVE